MTTAIQPPTIHVNSQVMTPNGRGTVQGRLRQNGSTQVLVSHDPALLPEEVRERGLYAGGIWVLFAYRPEEVEPA